MATFLSGHGVCNEWKLLLVTFYCIPHNMHGVAVYLCYSLILCEYEEYSDIWSVRVLLFSQTRRKTLIRQRFWRWNILEALVNIGLLTTAFTSIIQLLYLGLIPAFHSEHQIDTTRTNRNHPISFTSVVSFNSCLQFEHATRSLNSP